MAGNESVEQQGFIPTVETPPVADGDDRLAPGSLSAAHIVFMVMAAIAPAAVAVGLLPLAIGLGVGVGTPGVIGLVGLTLLCFAVGFTKMVPLIRNAGAFYAFIRRGLGNTAGLVAAFVALASYVAIAAAIAGGFAFFATITFSELFGLDLPWPVWAALCIAGVFALGYFRITLAATVLTVLFLAELTAVLVLDIAVLAQEGLGSFASLDAFAPSNVFVPGALGVTIIFAFAFFQGFEGAAIYSEEARDPDRTIPRATYTAIAAITVFYILTSMAMLVGGGGADAPANAMADPGMFVYGLTDTYVGSLWTKLLQVLIVTSMFAGVLAFHNAATRYMFSLARDGFLPKPLAAVHRSHQAPSVAGAVNAVLLLVICMGFAVAGMDPLIELSTSLTGFAAVGILAMVTVTSVAVAVYFGKRGQIDLRHVVAPVLGALGVGAGLVLSLSNYSALTGATGGWINQLPWIHLLVIALALVLAYRTRTKDPERWARAGDSQDHLIA